MKTPQHDETAATDAIRKAQQNPQDARAALTPGFGKYSDDQERDDHGRFSGGGGDSGGGGSNEDGGGRGAQDKLIGDKFSSKLGIGKDEVSITHDDEKETISVKAGDKGTYRMDIGSDDSNYNFERQGAGSGPKSVTFPIPEE